VKIVLAASVLTPTTVLPHRLLPDCVDHRL